MHGVGDVRFFNRIAPLYDRVMPAAGGAELTAGLSHADRDVDRVLDLGGGSGRASLALEDISERIVVDVSRGMVRRARERGLDCVFGDAGRLPFGDESTDAVIIVDALHHFPDRAACLAEVERVLCPGGVLVVREFDPDHPVGRLLAVGERAIGMDSAFVAPDALAREVAAVGLDPAVIDRGFGYTVVGTEPRAVQP